MIFNSIEEAQKSIHQIKTKEKELMTEQLKEILENEKINTLLQPIINLSNNNIIGYEAFNYGPEGNLKSPRKLFWLAKESDLTCRLDKICREKAVKKAIENKSNGLLFININLDAIGSPVFKEFLDSSSFISNKIPHDKIVFEVSEQSAVTNTDLFKMTFNYLKSMGFKTAIDDAGSGYYTNLQMINKIKPDFVKIDIPLIRDIDKDIIKQELVSTIVRLSSRSDIKTIAEGIETSVELNTLRDLNVQYGQGYFIAYPS
ncbi:MAG: EAL domain-containing protein [Actinobacteria bacterium]|nr:EAL domain-containing protein [Actinomycetota bacterium]